MKAFLSFDLPEDDVEFQSAQDGSKWAAVVHEIDNFLRSEVKHGSKKCDCYSEARKALYEAMNDYGVEAA